MADSLGTEFKWTKVTIPEVGHSNFGMAPTAAELFYDAFGRPKIKGTNIDNPSFNNKKYIAINNNLNEYRQLKDAINLKYPSINFQLDHP